MIAIEVNPTPAPRVNSGGVVHGASFGQDPLAPGTIVSIFGQDLSSQPPAGGLAAGMLPLPDELAATQMTLGGRTLPLLFSRATQVNAIVSFELADRVNESLPLLARRTDTNAVSMSEPVLVTAARPGVFTQNASGSGPGSIQDIGFQLVTEANPVSDGDVIIIYCGGLGAVAPEVVTGEAAPNLPLSQVAEQVTVTLGGVPAVVTFAGLVPGFASLYQINAIVPAGVVAGAAGLVVSIAGQVSPVVTLAVQ